MIDYRFTQYLISIFFYLGFFLSFFPDLIFNVTYFVYIFTIIYLRRYLYSSLWQPCNVDEQYFFAAKSWTTHGTCHDNQTNLKRIICEWQLCKISVCRNSLIFNLLMCKTATCLYCCIRFNRKYILKRRRFLSLKNWIVI